MNVGVSGIRRSSLVAVSSLGTAAEAATAMAPGTSAGPVNVTVSPNYLEPVRLVQFNPALAGVVMAMIISFFLVGFATGYLKKCIRPAEADPEDGGGQRRGPSRTGGATSKSQCGLDPEILESLPRVQYKDLPADEQVRKYSDCPVCLATFDANDSLRLLPVCSHAFHSDCIDVWFLSHSTCPLCRACLALPMEKATGVERRDDAEDVDIRVPEGFDVVEVVIGADSEQDRSRSSAISESLQGRTGGAPMASSSTVKEEGAHGLPFLWSNSVGPFKPAVRVVNAPEKVAALASIRRSNSAGTDLHLLHPSYVVDSEGTQHNRNYQTHAIDVEEFLLKDHCGAQAQPSESSSRHLVTLVQHWLRGDVQTGASTVTQPISRLGPQLVQSTRWSAPNLRHFDQLENLESS